MAFIDALWKYLVLSAPYLLLGLTLAGLVHAFLNVETVKRWLGRGRWSDVFFASLVGVPLPLCSCSVIPTAVALKKSGASNAATSSFLIATPESGVDSILVTYALMDFPMTVMRPLAAFASAFVAGGLQLFFNQESSIPMFTPATPAVKSCCAHEHKPEVKKIAMGTKFKQGLRYAYVDLIDDLAFWLTVGITAGALLDLVVPADFFNTLGPLTSRFFIVLIGVPLYICASATTPIAAALMLKGLSPGSALLLLLVGPATNFSNIFVMRKFLGTKGIVLNILAIVGVALGFSFLVDYLYTTIWGAPVIKLGHAHDHGSGAHWWEIASAAALAVLLLKGLWKEEIKPRLARKTHKDCCHT